MLRIGAVAFGGLGAALALLQHELVERRRWPAPHDLSEALAFTKPLPGSTVVQVVAFLGWRLRGWPGAILAAAAFIAPAAALMIGAAAASAALPSTPWVRGALTGLQTTVVGVLAAAMWRLGRNEAQGALMIVLLVMVVFVAVGASQIAPPSRNDLRHDRVARRFHRASEHAGFTQASVRASQLPASNGDGPHRR